MSELLSVTQLRRVTRRTREWLDDLARREPFRSPEQAYAFLGAVLHAVRDRLPPDEASHLARQLPVIVQGIYFEGWRPAQPPSDLDSVEAFLGRIEEGLRGSKAASQPDREAGARAVLAFLSDRMDPEVLRHFTSRLPREITELFPPDVVR